jgi:hypothetical protein
MKPENARVRFVPESELGPVDRPEGVDRRVPQPVKIGDKTLTLFC